MLQSVRNLRIRTSRSCFQICRRRSRRNFPCPLRTSTNIPDAGLQRGPEEEELAAGLKPVQAVPEAAQARVPELAQRKRLAQEMHVARATRISGPQAQLLQP